MKYTTYIIIIYILSSIYTVGISFANSEAETGSCPIGQKVPTIELHKSNIKRVLEEAVSVGSNGQCRKENPSFYGKEDTLFLMRHLESRCTNPFRSLSETFFYFEQTAGGQKREILKDREDLSEFQGEILSSVQKIGQKCGKSQVFKEDIQLGDITYNSKGKEVITVLCDVYRGHSNLVSAVEQDNSKIPRSSILDADLTFLPEGSREKITQHYQKKDELVCQEEKPSFKAIGDKLKNLANLTTFFNGSTREWKEGWRLLIRANGGDISSIDGRRLQEAEKKKYEAKLDQQIKAIIARQKGFRGFSDSSVVIDYETLFEYGKKGDRTTPSIGEQVQRMVTNTIINPVGNVFSNTILWSLTEAKKEQEVVIDTGSINPRSQQLAQAQAIQSSLAERYNSINENTLQKSSQQKHDLTSLIQLTQKFPEIEKLTRYNAKIACEKILPRQAVNVDTPDCRDFAKKK